MRSTYADHPPFTLSDVCRLAHDLLERPITHAWGSPWSAPVEVRAAPAGALRAQLDRGIPPRPKNDDAADDVVHPLVLAWRDGGGSGAQHVWHAAEAEAEQRGISQHDLAWASAECIIHFRLLSLFTPRPIALQVVTFALEGRLLPAIELRPLLGVCPRPGRLTSETEAQLAACVRIMEH